MHVGEGMRIAGGLAGLIGIGALFAWAMIRAEKNWRAGIDNWPTDNDAEAEAMCPELAAARCFRRNAEGS